MRSAHFIYDASERNVDLYYATGFRAPDPFLFFMKRGRKCIVLNDLEIDRARKTARVDEVISLNPYLQRVVATKKGARFSDVLRVILAEHGIRSVITPKGTSFALVDALRKRGIRVEAGPDPFFPGRLEKSAAERRAILESQRAIFASMRMAREVLAASRIKGRRLVYRGATLTSERLRSMIEVFLMERGFAAAGTIVAGGRHAIDPHDVGSGPLAPHTAIIVDVFPRSNETFYYGDATRTFCRGRAPEALRRMHATVRAAQEMGIRMIRAGVNGRTIHRSILALFERKGYKTGMHGGRNEGFFHGTGHGIGLELHEEPVRIAHKDFRLKKGHVVSVEPGLYYADIGGVRIEDLVHVTARGGDVLGHFPKQLEVI
jgi:Xaa-Pro aminopeptidase